MHSKRLAQAAIAVLAASLLAASARAQQSAELTSFLRDGIGLDAAQMAAVNRGEAVVKVLATGDQRDVAIFGIVTVPMSRDAYLRRVLDPATAAAQPSRVHFGVFSTPATSADMQRFTLDGDELSDLRKCKPNDCDFKLPGVLMDSVRQLLVGSESQQLARAAAYARQRLAQYVSDYRARGEDAMAVYEDRGRVLSSEAFDRLLAESPYGAKYSAAITRHLDRFPADTLAGAQEAIYWSQDHPPHLRQTLTLWHRVIYTPSDRPNLTIIAARQIYADHYFEAALDLSSVLARSTTAGAESSYLVVLRRYRFDNLPQGILKIHDRAVSALAEQLRSELR